MMTSSADVLGTNAATPINQPLAEPSYLARTGALVYTRADGSFTARDWDGEHHYKKDSAGNWEEYLPAEKSMVSDSEYDAITNLANDYNIRLTPETKDYLIQYMLNEKAAENSQLREYEAQKNYYPNLVEGLSKAGLNPMLALGSLSGGGSGASSSGVSGNNFTSRANAKQQAQSDKSRMLMSALAIIAAAMIRAL